MSLRDLLSRQRTDDDERAELRAAMLAGRMPSVKVPWDWKQTYRGPFWFCQLGYPTPTVINDLSLGEAVELFARYGFTNQNESGRAAVCDSDGIVVVGYMGGEAVATEIGIAQLRRHEFLNPTLILDLEMASRATLGAPADG